MVRAFGIGSMAKLSEGLESVLSFPNSLAGFLIADAVQQMGFNA